MSDDKTECAKDEACIDYKYLYTEGPSWDDPYPTIICGKGHWDGISDYNELYEKIECEDYVNK